MGDTAAQHWYPIDAFNRAGLPYRLLKLVDLMWLNINEVKSRCLAGHGFGDLTREIALDNNNGNQNGKAKPHR